MVFIGLLMICLAILIDYEGADIPYCTALFCTAIATKLINKQIDIC